MRHRITRGEATAIRDLVDGRIEEIPSSRIFRPPLGDLGDAPISVVAASGRSGCRECGETIAAGEDAIVFGFSPTGAVWAVGRAYLHRDSCRDYPEED